MRHDFNMNNNVNTQQFCISLCLDIWVERSESDVSTCISFNAFCSMNFKFHDYKIEIRNPTKM